MKSSLLLGVTLLIFLMGCLPSDPEPVVGPAGAKGAQGIQGPVGEIGIQGPPGNNGPSGPVGPVGSQGVSGGIGPKGDSGDPGGPVGPKGDEGDIGPQGLEGSQGPIGLDGPQGARGPIGNTGNIGVQGVEGPLGSRGPQGQIGPTGRLAGWIRITDIFSGVGGGDPRTLDLICPEDTKVISGGYSISSESFQYLPEQIIVVENLPLSQGNGWRVSATRPPVTYPWALSGFAICAEVE